MKIRVSRAVRSYLDGGSLFSDEPNHGYGTAGERMRDKIRAASGRKDGSVVVDLEVDEADILHDLADYMQDSAASDAGWNASALGDLNAGRALMRQIENAR